MLQSAIKMVILPLVLLALPTLGQDHNAPPAGQPGCGNPAVKFSVKTKVGHYPSQPEAGKAMVYFIEDDSNYNSVPKPTTRAGLDGQWVGATHGNSVLYFSVAPGVHHLCASWQSGRSYLGDALLGVSTGQDGKSAAAGFTADAGDVYYFEVKNTYISHEHSPNILDMDLIRLNNDEGQLLANERRLSVSKKK